MGDVSERGKAIKHAFFAAGDRLVNDERIIFTPWFDEDHDMIDTSGAGMPDEFWDLFLQELARITNHKFVEETICIDCTRDCTDDLCNPENPQMGTDYCKICGLLEFTPEAQAIHED